MLGFCNDEISLLNNQDESFCGFSRCEERGKARQLHLSDLQRSFPVPRVLQILKADPSTDTNVSAALIHKGSFCIAPPPQGLGSIMGKKRQKDYTSQSLGRTRGKMFPGRGRTTVLMNAWHLCMPVQNLHRIKLVTLPHGRAGALADSLSWFSDLP